MADEYEFYVQASVRGYHAYFVDAMVYIGEIMDCEMEPENDNDKYAAAVRNKDEKMRRNSRILFKKQLNEHFMF